MITGSERPKQEANAEYGRFGAMREYSVRGSLEKVEILQWLAANSPATDAITDVDGNPIAVFRVGIAAREIGGNKWDGRVNYAHTPDQFDLKFNNGTQQVKMMQSLGTTRVYDCIDGSTSTGAATTNVPDLKGAINISGEGSSLKVEGTDIEIGKTEFTITKKQKFATLDAGYEAYLASVTPSVNDALWSFVWKTQLFAFVRGAVLFRGHTTNQNSDGDLSITHSFAYSKGLTTTTPWDVAGTYGLGALVSHNGSIWASLISGNTASTPTLYDDYDFATTYAIGNDVRFGAYAYNSEVGGNINNRPDISPLQWSVIGVINWEYVGPDTAFRIGGSAAIEKEGWEYGHPFYRPGVASGVVLPIPTGFIVSRTYDYSDFARLECF